MFKVIFYLLNLVLLYKRSNLIRQRDIWEICRSSLTNFKISILLINNILISNKYYKYFKIYIMLYVY